MHSIQLTDTFIHNSSERNRDLVFLLFLTFYQNWCATTNTIFISRCIFHFNFTFCCVPLTCIAINIPFIYSNLSVLYASPTQTYASNNNNNNNIKKTQISNIHLYNHSNAINQAHWNYWVQHICRFQYQIHFNAKQYNTTPRIRWQQISGWANVCKTIHTGKDISTDAMSSTKIQRKTKSKERILGNEMIENTRRFSTSNRWKFWFQMCWRFTK